MSIDEMLAAEKRALAKGWTHAELLSAAGEALGHALGRFFPRAGTAIAYLGKGHNAGDAVIALRILRDSYGWSIACRHAYPFEFCSPLLRQHALALGALKDL
ncbi:MAG TPA: hypothetical protein VFY13_00005, partial [Luteolibacter sp.]|nr:hypothetical protein [Luteolibacter sp.]